MNLACWYTVYIKHSFPHQLLHTNSFADFTVANIYHSLTCFWDVLNLGAATIRIGMPSHMQSSLIFHYNLKLYNSDKDSYDTVSLKRFVMQVSWVSAHCRWYRLVCHKTLFNLLPSRRVPATPVIRDNQFLYYLIGLIVSSFYRPSFSISKWRYKKYGL